MKIGDLVTSPGWPPDTIGLIVELYESKFWQTDEMGKLVAWHKIAPESFARVLVGNKKNILSIPVRKLIIASGC